MKTIFIPFSEVEKKNIIEYMFDNLNVASTDNGNYGYIVTGYDYEKYICQYSNEAMAEAVKLIAGRAKTEASGNMSIPRLKGVAATGVDYISVGALTHSVTAMDISMNIIKM